MAAARGATERSVTLLPLMWARPLLHLPSWALLRAWALCDFSQPPSPDARWEDLDWQVSPQEIRRRADSGDESAQDLAEVMIDGSLSRHGSAWRIVLPRFLRDLGYLAEAGEYLIARLSPHYLGLWTSRAWAVHIDQLSLRSADQPHE